MFLLHRIELLASSLLSFSSIDENTNSILEPGKYVGVTFIVWDDILFYILYWDYCISNELLKADKSKQLLNN